jgi:hypothetical protein
VCLHATRETRATLDSHYTKCSYSRTTNIAVLSKSIANGCSQQYDSRITMYCNIKGSKSISFYLFRLCIGMGGSFTCNILGAHSHTIIFAGDAFSFSPLIAPDILDQPLVFHQCVSRNPYSWCGGRDRLGQVSRLGSRPSEPPVFGNKRLPFREAVPPPS